MMKEITVVSRMKKEGIKQKWCRLFPYIAYMELTDLNKYPVLRFGE